MRLAEAWEMARTVDRSCYVLELSVQPGGSRWAELHAYTNPEHIRAWLAAFCENSMGQSAYHSLWYGATLAIWIVQHGVAERVIDLHEHIRVHLADKPTARLCDHAACKALVLGARPRDQSDEEDASEAAASEQAEDAEDADASWDPEESDYLIYEAMKLSFDWTAIAPLLPALGLPLLEPGQQTRIRHAAPPRMDTYLRHSVRFGSVDQEAGVELEPPFVIDAQA